MHEKENTTPTPRPTQTLNATPNTHPFSPATSTTTSSFLLSDTPDFLSPQAQSRHHTDSTAVYQGKWSSSKGSQE